MAYTIQKGGNIVFLVDDTAIECLTQSDFNATADELETTCKNSGNNKSFEDGAKTFEFSIGGNYTEDTAGTGTNEDYHTLFTKFNSSTAFAGKWGGVDVGDKTYSSASCKVTSINVSAGNSGTLVTWTATIKVSGAITVATIS